MSRNIGVKGAKEWGKPNWRRRLPYANDLFRASSNALGEQFATTKGTGSAEVLVRHPANHDDGGYVSSAYVIKNTSHRDGSIYTRDSGLRG